MQKILNLNWNLSSYHCHKMTSFQSIPTRWFDIYSSQIYWRRPPIRIVKPNKKSIKNELTGQIHQSRQTKSLLKYLKYLRRNEMIIKKTLAKNSTTDQPKDISIETK